MAFPEQLSEEEYNQALAVLTEIVPKEKLNTTVKNLCIRKDLDEFNLVDMCRIFRVADFKRMNIPKVYQSYNKKFSIATLRNRLTKYKKFFGLFNANDIRKSIAKTIDKKTEVEKEAQKVAKQIQKTKDIMDVFNLKYNEIDTRVREIIKDVDKNSNKAMEEYLKELHLLRMMFLETAKGSLYTNKITASYVVEEDEEGNIISKQLYTNRKGQKIVTVETQTHLPDAKSLVALNLVEDLILKATATMTSTVIDEEEVQEKYLEYIKEAQRQKREYLDGGSDTPVEVSS
jgi:hypothetical protein